MLNPSLFAATTPADASSTKWRIKFLWLNDSSGGASAREIQFRSVPGGTNHCTGAVIAASRFGGFLPSNANDGNAGTEWQAGYQLNEPDWWSAESSTPYTLNEITMTAGGNEADRVKHFDVQYYDGAQWITYWSVRNTLIAAGATVVYTRTADNGSLGPELLTANPTTSSGWAWSGGVGTASATPGSLTWTGTVTEGRAYQLSLKYTKSAGSKLRVKASSGEHLCVLSIANASGELFFTFVAKGSSFILEPHSADFTGTVSEVSLREMIYSTVGLGTERLSDPSFDTGTGWSFAGGWSLGSGKAVGSNGADRIAAAGVMTNGLTYRVGFNYYMLTGQRLRVRTNAGVTKYLTPVLRRTGAMYAEFVADGTDLRIEADSQAFTGEIYGVTLRQKL